MIVLRTLDAAPKCAFRLLRRDDAIPGFASAQNAVWGSATECLPDAEFFIMAVDECRVFDSSDAKDAAA